MIYSIEDEKCRIRNAHAYSRDADACPKVIKEIIFRAAIRLNIKTTCYANHAIPIPRTPFIKNVQVMGGFVCWLIKKLWMIASPMIW